MAIKDFGEQFIKAMNDAWQNGNFEALEALEDPASAEIRVLPKTLIIDLSALKGIPEKIEGVAILPA